MSGRRILSRAEIEAMRDNAAERYSEEQTRALAETALARIAELDRCLGVLDEVRAVLNAESEGRE